MFLILANAVLINDVGSYASVIYKNDKSLKVSVGKGSATLLQLQTLSVIESIKLGLLCLEKDKMIEVLTDSEYVSDVCNRLPAFKRNGFANMKNPGMWREMYEVMRIAGDRLYVNYNENHNELYELNLKTARLANRLPLSDYPHNPDTYHNVIRGVILK